MLVGHVQQLEKGLLFPARHGLVPLGKVIRMQSEVPGGVDILAVHENITSFPRRSRK